MVKTLLGRLGVFVASLLGASVAIFIVCQALPGDPARILLGDGASDEQVAVKAHELGTDRPWLVRYIDWVSGMAHGDFGVSYASGVPVSSLIAPTVGVTAWLAFFSLLLAVIIALPLGMLAALRRKRAAGVAVSAMAQVGMAVPAFWAGILLATFFGVRLRWLPPNGYVPLDVDPVRWVRSLVLPVTSLALVQSAVLIRYVRGAFVDVIGEEYYRTARSVGWREWPALFRHGLRNASLSLVTVLGLQLASILVGAIVIEQVFVLPGLGSLLLTYVKQSDMMVIQGVVMLLVVAVLAINTAVEMAYVALDPRVRARST